MVSEALKRVWRSQGRVLYSVFGEGGHVLRECSVEAAGEGRNEGA